MEKYNFKDNTLLHSIGFNPFRLESILENGILSQNEAKKEGISHARNYVGYNLDNYISMTRPLYSYEGDENSCYNKYVKKGISLIIENQEFIYDKNDTYFNHADEVFVETKVPTKNIVGILLPSDLKNENIIDLPMINTRSTSYKNIKEMTTTLVEYLKENGKEPSDELPYLLTYIARTLKAYSVDKDDDLLNDFEEGKQELDAFLAEQVKEHFSKVLNKENVTLYDVVTYINQKTLNLPIYEIETRRKKRHV